MGRNKLKMVKIIESEEEYKTVTQSGGLVVVDFFGTPMVQTPMRCLDPMDTTLLVLSGISVVGVVFGIITTYKYGHKVFNQSHSSGRDGKGNGKGNEKND